MTLRHFRIFAAVYREMSITKAAEKLYMTQPSVSLAVREMEEHYQVRLFTDMQDRFWSLWRRRKELCALPQRR